MRKYLLPGFLLILDILILIVSAFLSLYLRFDMLVVNEYFVKVLMTLPIFAGCYLISLAFFHMYTRVWRYAGTRELAAVLAATSVGGFAFFVINTVMGIVVPRSLYVISYVLVTCAVGLSRLVLHYIIIRSDLHQVAADDQVPVLIIGAGDAGATIAREIMSYHRQRRRIVGFVDDDEQKQNHFLGGHKVLGKRQDIPSLVRENKVQEIIIAMPSAGASTIREIVEVCAPLKCHVNILPGIYQLLNHEVTVSSLRPVSIEDLLQRDPIQLDLREIASYLQGKKVLVTGAGGSIGSEICRQIMGMKPEQLVLLGHGENSIYLIHQELSQTYGTERLVPVIADIRDGEQMEHIFREYKPQVVFHAAAHKHVPLMERQPMAAILNNVYGTRIVTNMAGKYGVKKFVMISTDKAVNPTSVMGATKQVAEKVVQVMNNHYDTEYVTVRFGNVLGSRGSVIPLFRKQLAAGGPLTVTYPEMTRYFMTIPEASQLVLQAGGMGKGGELFLLDMGEPVKIMDLAKNMISLSGMEPGKDIEIKITGLRPGEKLYEELLTAEEGTKHTKHAKIYEAKLEPVNEQWLDKKIAAFASCRTPEDVIEVLKEIIPTYHPNHNPVNPENAH